MGEVVAVFRIMPADGADFDQMKDTVVKAVVKAIGKVDNRRDEPLAFGITAFKITVVMPDDAGGTDKLEQMLAKLPGVGDVQVTDVGRLM